MILAVTDPIDRFCSCFWTLFFSHRLPRATLSTTSTRPPSTPPSFAEPRTSARHFDGSVRVPLSSDARVRLGVGTSSSECLSSNMYQRGDRRGLQGVSWSSSSRAVKHVRTLNAEIKRASTMTEEELYTYAKVGRLACALSRRSNPDRPGCRACRTFKRLTTS